MAPRAEDALLSVDGIFAGYGRLDILHGVSLAVGPGEVVAIIGPNGAGKSTVLKAVMGLVRVSSGSVTFDGRTITGGRPNDRVAWGLGYVPQGRVVFPRMTVRENLDMGAFTVRSPAARAEARDFVLTLFPRLAERPSQVAGTMSGGEQQMLSIARALMTRPKAVLLDEPSLGLSPRFVDMVFDQVLVLKEQSLAIALVEQNAVRALEIAHRGYVLELGANKYEGPAAELAGDERIRKMYLGG